MSEVMQGTSRFAIEQIEGPVTHRDYLVLAGSYKQAHPELDRGSQSLVHLKDTLDYLANPENPNTGLLLAREVQYRQARAIGAAMLYVMGGPEPGARSTLVEEIFVDKRFRGNKVGALLMEAVTDFAYAHDSTHIHIGIKPQTEGATRLFRVMGFEEDKWGHLHRKLVS